MAAKDPSGLFDSSDEEDNSICSYVPVYYVSGEAPTQNTALASLGPVVHCIHVWKVDRHEFNQPMPEYVWVRMVDHGRMTKVHLVNIKEESD